MRFSLKTSEQTYDLEIGRMAQSDIADVRPMCDREFYFHQLSYSSCFLIVKLCFTRNRTDDRSFLSIRGYRALRELHGGALRPR
jgi:hypothetical protein